MARYKGIKSKGIRAPQVEYHTALLEELTRKPRLTAAISRLDLPVAPDTVPQKGKVSSRDANYTDDGPYPFTCGNCQYIVWGQYDGGDFDFCQIVKGPHKQGGIYPKGSCRFFKEKPYLGGAS